jgi:hypothetical protein
MFRERNRKNVFSKGLSKRKRIGSFRLPIFEFWDKYMIAYEEALAHTSTPWAPWFVVPADHEWFSRVCVSQIIVATLKALGLRYPKPTKEQLDELEKAKQELLKED